MLVVKIYKNLVSALTHSHIHVAHNEHNVSIGLHSEQFKRKRYNI